ncbi:hypothetical protein [Shewanella surugensis]|uniref:Uncharacterized protein n=1 Tax=Shewanella surugensis TaxID=212020 RepID=A0ABT0LJ21_9GAMM|nr:hypothetical protein [Shewanella surugensis]MCL1127455.1 hypothetical protein [Shewanella surugensis]
MASTSKLNLVTNAVTNVTNDVKLIANDVRSKVLTVPQTKADIQQKAIEINAVTARLDNAEAEAKINVVLADHEASLESAGVNIIDAGITMFG